MATQQQFSMEDMKDILVNRVGLPADTVGDDPSKSFDDLGLDSLAFVEIQLAVLYRAAHPHPTAAAASQSGGRRAEAICPAKPLTPCCPKRRFPVGAESAS